MTLQDLRRSYELRSLGRAELNDDPIAQFQKWFAEAASTWPDTSVKPDWFELNAMTLASYDPQSGQVYARIVLLKYVAAAGFTFFTNYDSDKGQQLAAHPLASLVFYWPHLERQVRVQGRVAQTDRATSEQYFHARPRASQLGAAASQQSNVIANRQVLEAEAARLDWLYKDREVPCPENWGGFLLTPHELEFWQGRADRLHDRFVYRLDRNTQPPQWDIDRLAP